MNNDADFSTLAQQNEVIIGLLARLVWKPEELTEIVKYGKRNQDAYVSVYNALDGKKTGKQLAEIAGVTQPAISMVLQTWQDEGIVMNVGSDSVPKYRRLMRLPEPRKSRTKQTKPQEKEQAISVEQEKQETNASQQ